MSTAQSTYIKRIAVEFTITIIVRKLWKKVHIYNAIIIFNGYN